MLAQLSVTWGCQPDYLMPDDPNLVRLRPAVQLDVGHYFVPLSWNFVHGLFPWIADLLHSSGQRSLLEAVRRHRDVATETLTREVLHRIFGSLSVGPLYYDHEGKHGEIDALVATGTSRLVFECKAHTLTPAGRRGAPARVHRVVDDVVGAGMDQLVRARRYLATGACHFADRQGGEPEKRLPVPAREVIEVLVTFERMDPIAVTSGGAETPARIWQVCLADLLMVGELLPAPAEFFDYAAVRASLGASGVMVYVEADALAVYLNDRFRELIAASAAGNALLGYAAGPINDYYTLTPFGVDVPRPQSQVPTEVLVALDRVMTSAPESWVRLAAAVMRQEPRVWRKWAKRARRKKRHDWMEFRCDDPPLVIRTTAVGSREKLETPTLTLGPARVDGE